ncbi:MAG: efflux RND transporter periplasmic adaptor subunit [Oscillospiraceae bacterium]
MNMLTRAWNYLPSPEARRSVKSRAVAALVWLLALMLCFTLISRATSSMTVPVVETEKPNRASISHKVTTDGILETAWDKGVVAAQGALVQEVHVKEGDTVAAGDLLFTYDTAEFNRQISEYQTQLAQINTRIRSYQNQQTLDEESKELAVERAKEDLEATEGQGDLDAEIAEEQVLSAGERFRAAKEALRKYEGIRRSDYDDYEDGEYTKEEYDRLRTECNQAQIAYDEAVLSQEKMLSQKEKAALDAQRVLEDSGRPAAPDASIDLERLDAQSINLKLSVLYEAVENDGEVYAPVDGVVTDVRVGAGTRTTDEAAMFINNSATMNFVAEVSKDQKKHVNAGNTVKLRMAGESADIQGLSVTSVQPSTVEGSYRVTVELPADYAPGTSGTLEIEERSKTYDTVVPLSALQAEGSQFYVLRVRESETSLGTECFAERIDVTVLEKNETYAAVSGALATEDKVIHSTSRTIQDGDRVRLPAEE